MSLSKTITVYFFFLCQLSCLYLISLAAQQNAWWVGLVVLALILVLSLFGIAAAMVIGKWEDSDGK